MNQNKIKKVNLPLIPFDAFPAEKVASVWVWVLFSIVVVLRYNWMLKLNRNNLLKILMQNMQHFLHAKCQNINEICRARFFL